MGINKFFIEGNLGKNPEGRKVGDKDVASFSIAASDGYKDKSGEWQNKTYWFNIVAWGRLAQQALTLTKGERVVIEGKMTNREYEAGDQKKTAYDVVAYSILKAEYISTESKKEESTASGGSDFNSDDLPF